MDAAQLAMTTAAALAPVLPYLLKKAGDLVFHINSLLANHMKAISE